MPSELLATLLTLDDRETLRTELELLRNAVFQTKENSFPEALKIKVRNSIAEIIEREVRLQKTEPEKYLSEVLQQLDQVPILELTIAFEPTQENLEHIVAHASKLLSQTVITQLHIQPEVVAGAVIVWNGHYHDASLKTQFEKSTQNVIGKVFGKTP